MVFNEEGIVAAELIEIEPIKRLTSLMIYQASPKPDRKNMGFRRWMRTEGDRSESPGELNIFTDSASKDRRISGPNNDQTCRNILVYQED